MRSHRNADTCTCPHSLAEGSRINDPFAIPIASSAESPPMALETTSSRKHLADNGRSPSWSEWTLRPSQNESQWPYHVHGREHLVSRDHSRSNIDGTLTGVHCLDVSLSAILDHSSLLTPLTRERCDTTEIAAECAHGLHAGLSSLSRCRSLWIFLVTG